VQLGRRSGDLVEIVAGLTPGQRIIADGSFLLKSDVLRSKMGAGCAD
jgi:cobalt-zinc-cadmium efflux system membrane fusion protein